MSNSVITILEEKIENLKKNIAINYDEQINAGSESLGDLRNQQSRNLSKLSIFEEQLTQMKDVDSTKEDRKNKEYSVFVLSAGIDRIKKNVGDQIYKMLKLALHGTTSRDWRPFSTVSVSINEILLELQDLGFAFNYFFIEGEPTDDQLINIMQNKKDNMAIVDLLSLDDENIKTALRFDDEYAAILTPICSDIDKTLKDIMKAVRKRIFRYSEIVYVNPNFDFYHMDVSEYFIFKGKLQRLIPKKQSFNAIISNNPNQFNGKSGALPSL